MHNKIEIEILDAEDQLQGLEPLISDGASKFPSRPQLPICKTVHTVVSTSSG